MTQAVTSDELYGYMTLAKEWKDGVLSIIMRNMSKVSVRAKIIKKYRHEPLPHRY